MLNHEKNHSSAQPQLSSAAPSGAVRCRALPCGAVPCCAVLCFLSNKQQYQVSCDTRYRPVCTCVLVFFSLSSFDCPLSVILPPSRKLHPYWRSERDIANKHTQHSTGQSALGIFKSLDAPNNHAPLRSAAFTFSCILPCASVAGGVSRPRSGAVVPNTKTTGSNADLRVRAQNKIERLKIVLLTLALACQQGSRRPVSFTRVYAVFFPGVFLSSRVTGACPVTTDLNMRVNVRTTNNKNAPRDTCDRTVTRSLQSRLRPILLFFSEFYVFPKKLG